MNFYNEIIDSLKMARKIVQEKKYLDALCERYAIDNSDRTARPLLDAKLLAFVYSR